MLFRSLGGIDFEIDYRLPFLGGRLGLSALANYQWQFARTTPGSISINRAGEVGLSDNPEWKGTFTANYKTGPIELSWKQRYIHKGKYDVTFVEGVDINDKDRKSVE